MKKPKRLTDKIWHGEQSWYYEALWDFFGEKIKIRIRRNAYDFQSYAVAEIYDPAKREWNSLSEIPFPQMRSLAISAYMKEGFDEGPFLEDQETLLNEAKLVLGK